MLAGAFSACGASATEHHHSLARAVKANTCSGHWTVTSNRTEIGRIRALQWGEATNVRFN